MASPERQTDNSNNNIVEILALFSLGEIKMENVDDSNKFILRFYLSKMDDDPKLRKKVISRKNAMALSRKNGERIPLYRDEELGNLRKHRKCKKKRTRNLYSQPELFSKEPSLVGNTKKYDYIDPEKKLTELHGEFNSPYGPRKNSLVDKEIRYNRLKLRKVIGLPIARGKDPHVRDEYYKFLVKWVVKLDAFKIFGEYNGIKFSDEPTDLDIRISQVGSFISDVLNSDINRREKYDRYHEFVNKYSEEWNIIVINLRQFAI